MNHWSLLLDQSGSGHLGRHYFHSWCPYRTFVRHKNKNKLLSYIKINYNKNILQRYIGPGGSLNSLKCIVFVSHPNAMASGVRGSWQWSHRHRAGHQRLPLLLALRRHPNQRPQLLRPWLGLQQHYRCLWLGIQHPWMSTWYILTCFEYQK